MITEDYVSFETAKLLKEKGFDELCPGFYETDEPDNGPKYCGKLGWFLHNSYDYSDRYGKMIISAPTLQMTMKWLREEQNLFIEIQCYGCEANKKAHFEYSYVISEFVKIDNKICTVVGLEEKKAKSRFSSYEEACEEAIKYALENLI